MPAQRGTTATAVFSAGTVVTPTNLAPTLPAGYQTGDLLLCYTACRSATPTVATPAGWTSLVNVTGTNGRLALFGKIAASTTETAPTVTWSGLTTGNSGTPCGAQCAAFSLTSPSYLATVDVTGTVENLTASITASASGTAITTVANNDLVLALSTRLDDAGTWTAPAGFTLLGGAGTTSGSDYAQAWAFQVKTPAGSVTPADFGLASASSFASSGVLVALQELAPTTYTDSGTGTITGTGAGIDSYSTPTPYDLEIDTDNPVAHWKLGASTTAANDRKGTQNLPAVNGPLSTTPGLVANNDSDPANTFVRASNQKFGDNTGLPTPYDTANFTVEAWFKPATIPTGSPSIIDRNTNQGLYIATSAGAFGTRLRDVGGLNQTIQLASATIVAGQTYYAACTYDGTTLILYLDGVERGRITTTKGTITGTPRIGGTAVATAAFDGVIDEVAWYNTALTPARVLAHYNAGLPPAGGPTHNDTATGTIVASGSGVETYEPPAAGTIYTDAASGAIASSGSALETAAATDSRTGATAATGTALESATASDSRTGTIAASGTGTDNWTIGYTDSRTGTITSSGTATESAANTDSRLGTATAAGTALEAHVRASTATGNLAASGTSTEAAAYTDTQPATLTTTGTGTENYQPPTAETVYTDTAAGTITNSGIALDAHARTGTATGQITTTGTGLETYLPVGPAYDDTQTGQLTLTGTSLESWGINYADAQQGDITATGALEHATTYTDLCSGTIHLHGTSTTITTRQRLRQGHHAYGEPIPPYPAWPTPGTNRRPRRGQHPVGAAGRTRTPA